MEQAESSYVQGTPDVHSIPIKATDGSINWIPRCPDQLKPHQHMIFKSLKEGEQFYKDYAFVSGFETRYYTERKKRDGVIELKYMVCTRHGYRHEKTESKENKEDTTSVASKNHKKRKRPITRVGCRAKIGIKLLPNGTHKVITFHEPHAHELVSPQSREIIGDELNVGHMHVIFSMSKLNKGATTSFRSVKELCGGYDKVGASLNAFKNFQRDIKASIGKADGQMFIQLLSKKKQNCPAFQFEYELDEDESLTKAFWADPMSQKNYFLFGDVVSFDTTYGTNKYSMIFCPFTGVDHHKKCVTFGAALLAKEDIQSFEWLFKTFLKVMDNRTPSYMITDQDPAMKIAIDTVFKSTKHRFCMWHIMSKLSKKVPPSICANKAFLDSINSCVWDIDIEIDEFEEKWMAMIIEYNLESNEWLQLMFSLRDMWIPAYFRDLFMGSLLRTTSRSESENSFFDTFTNEHISLVELWARFESAMDAQRHIHSLLNKKSSNSSPELKTCLRMEIHASKVYTHSLFYDVQQQMIGCI